MRITTIVTALALAATPALLSAQATSAKPETVYVKGYVTGEVPPPGATVRGVTGVIISTTIIDTTRVPTTMTTTTTTTTTTTPPKPKLARKISHGAGEAAGDVSKLGKKAVHGAKEAASDVKKKVTRKP
jgi:hypothetical protein